MWRTEAAISRAAVKTARRCGSERIGGLVEEESATVEARLHQDGRLYFQRKGDTLTLEDLSRLIVSLADRF